MSNILITGATGNVGLEVIRFLMTKINDDDSLEKHKIIAGVRNVEKAKKNTFQNECYSDLAYTHFDFEDLDTFDNALNGIDKVFLLRPPHIADINKYFKPFILKMKEKNIKQVVFLSVQGVEKSKAIPHNKIEQLIMDSGLDYIFLRPSYFMQNLTTTLLQDIQTKREIILPAGDAKFNWIDVENIGEVGAIVLLDEGQFKVYKNQGIEITGQENENFHKVTELINDVIDNPITYRNINPIRFFWIKKREGMVTGMIIVMILLHFLHRFENEPNISDSFEQLTGKKPTDLKTFIERERNKLDKQENC